jgi:hypothetical protein
MYKFFLFAAFSVVLISEVSAQPKLRQNIGVDGLPNDTDSICPLAGKYSMDFYNAGIHLGDTAYDFTLYDADGHPTSLSGVLSKGKPVMLISGSYTCPIFRSNVPSINSVVGAYGKYINTYIIYTAEAHPFIDPCPYDTDPQISNEMNRADSIFYRQPKTYGDRKSIEYAMSKALTINAPIIFDAPCNQWLLNYGPAPNIAYLIDAQGIVRYKEPWFNLNGSFAADDINELLSIDTASDRADTGSITFQLTSNDTIFTTPGKTVVLSGLLVNSSDAAAIVHLKRHNSTKMPAGWETAICTNVCLSPNEDTAIVRVPAHSTQTVSIYFYVGTDTGTGRVYLHFTDENILSDSSKIRLVCIATATEGVSSGQTVSKPQVTIVPNPAARNWTLRSDIRYSSVRIYDMLGRIISESAATNEYSAQTLACGVYRVQLLSSSKAVLGETTLVRQ